MNRLNIIQNAIDRLQGKHYLEIGVNKGRVFLYIKAPHKVGVDPCFQFSIGKRLKLWRQFATAKTYSLTSDDFFKNAMKKEFPEGIDVVFIDGLHTFDQALRDVESCLPLLNKNGIILMHDCNPPNAACAYPVKESINEVVALAKAGELSGWTGHWNGDVWKSLAMLRLNHPDLNIFTLDLDWGIGVISRHGAPIPLAYSKQEIHDADYSLLERDRQNILNLKPVQYWKTFLQGIKN